jgi:cytochrome c551/c552
LPAGDRVALPNGASWAIPSRAECLACHTDAAGRTLGLEVAQLNRVIRYPNGRAAAQIATLVELGLIAQPSDDELPTPLPALGGADSPARRARAYLHANCAFCHQPAGPGRGDLDLRFAVPLDETGLCHQPPRHGSLGLADPRLILPGDISRSVLPRRLRLLDVNRMPPLGSEVVHQQAVELIEYWIANLRTCR